MAGALHPEPSSRSAKFEAQIEEIRKFRANSRQIPKGGQSTFLEAEWLPPRSAARFGPEHDRAVREAKRQSVRIEQSAQKLGRRQSWQIDGHLAVQIDARVPQFFRVVFERQALLLQFLEQFLQADALGLQLERFLLDGQRRLLDQRRLSILGSAECGGHHLMLLEGTADDELVAVGGRVEPLDQ